MLPLRMLPLRVLPLRTAPPHRHPPHSLSRYSTAGVESSRAPQAGGSREVAQRKLALLSDREFEVAECIAQGLGNADIASRLFVSLTTVKTHIKHILDKVGGTNRVHIAITVLEAR